jgi:hypothetical protein
MGTYLRGRLSKNSKATTLAVDGAGLEKVEGLLMPRWEEGPYTRIQNRSVTLCLFTKFRRRMGRIPELLELCGNLSLDYENLTLANCWFQNGTASCELLV